MNQVVQYQYALDRTFGALSDQSRRAIVERLEAGQAPISELAQLLGITLTGTKKHVQILEAAGLVTTEKVGRTRFCRLGPRRLVPLPTIRICAWGGDLDKGCRRGALIRYRRLLRRCVLTKPALDLRLDLPPPYLLLLHAAAAELRPSERRGRGSPMTGLRASRLGVLRRSSKTDMSARTSPPRTLKSAGSFSRDS